MFSKLLEAALDEWKGTPEELGATLETASCPIEPLPLPGSTFRDSAIRRAQDINNARIRLIASGENCRKLLRYESEQRRNGYR